MFTIVQAVSTSKTSQKRSYEFETSVTIVRMSCNNVAINKKHKVHIYIYIYIIHILYIYIYYIYIYIICILYIYIYIYIYISNWVIECIHIYSYTIIYSRTVNISLMLICIEISELIIYCKYG